MSEKYEEIEFCVGNTIEQAVNKLLSYKAEGKLVYGEFNGAIFYSDTVTMDSAYKLITGKAKSEFDKSKQDWMLTKR